MKYLFFIILFSITTACTEETDNETPLTNSNNSDTDSLDNNSHSTDDSDSTSDAVDTNDDSTDNTGEDSATAIDTDNLQWQYANLTWYTSYPEEGSSECIDYNGCEWAGWFAGLDEQMSPEWVAEHNIAAVHSDHFALYNGKTIRVRSGDEHEIDVVVYDMCADSDCDGCCTDNMFATGFLIDMEIHTAERFGVMGGIVEFACLDCNK